MRFRTFVALSTVAALGAAPPHEAWSTTPTIWGTSPTAILGSFFERANSVLRAADPMRDLESPRRAIRGLVAEVFDFREAAAIALGPIWPSRTPQEQEEFIHLFADLLERGYIAVFSSKASLRGGGVTVQYLAESISGESASVPTRVLTRTGEELPVEYRLVRRDQRWTVRDVIVDGVSLVANYRAQFTRILGTSTFPDLMVRMRTAPDAPIFAAAARALAPAAPPGSSTPAAPASPVASTSESSAPDPAPNAQPDTPAPRSAGPAAPASPGLLATPAVATAKESASGGQPEPGKAPPAPAAPAKAAPVKPDARKADRPAVAGAAPAGKPNLPVVASAALAPKPERPAGDVANPGRQAPENAPGTTAVASAATSLMPAAKYWVQLGAFKTLEGAQILVSSLRPQTAIISTGPGPGAGSASLNRVRIGPFADHAQAQAKLRELDDRGYPGFIALTQD